MCVCMSVWYCVCMRMCVCMSVIVCACMCAFVRECFHVCVCVCVSVSVNESLSVCAWQWVWECLCLCTCECVCIHVSLSQKGQFSPWLVTVAGKHPKQNYLQGLFFIELCTACQSLFLCYRLHQTCIMIMKYSLRWRARFSAELASRLILVVSLVSHSHSARCWNFMREKGIITGLMYLILCV